MTRATVAAVIPCRNVAPYVESCIESVLAQTVPFSEVILVDDGSTDGTRDVIARYADRPGVVVHHNKQNLGLGPARNVGVGLAASTYVCFVDADDVVSGQLVASFLAALNRDAGLDLYCFSGVNFRDSVHNRLDGFHYRSEYSGSGSEAFVKLIENGTFASCPVLYVFRRELLDWRNHGFKAILHEDEELTPRLFLRADRVFVDPVVLYYRRLRTASITAAPITAESLKGCITALITLVRLAGRHVRERPVRRALGVRIRYLVRIVLGQARRLLLPARVRPSAVSS